MSTGFGPLYDGMAHLFVTPVDLMAVLAVAMLAGLRGAKPGRWALFGATTSWLIGGTIGLWVEADATPLVIGAAVGPLVIGLAVALDLRLPLAVTTSIAALVGAGFGLLNGLSLRASGADVQPLLGIIVAVFVCVTIVAAATVRATREQDWRRIAVRVGGSWITAISLLMMGWALKAGP
jgi:hydrogenase/urease accessory protein HupE